MALSQLELKPRKKRLDARLLHRTYYNNDIEASLDFGPTDRNFAPTVWGLATDASSGGCSIVAIEPSVRLEPGLSCRLQIDTIDPPIKASVVWVEEIDTNAFKLGLRFSDE